MTHSNLEMKNDEKHNIQKTAGPFRGRKNLRREIERSKTAIDSARNHFEQVIDPTLIDCYIYELNAAQLRYQFLLRRFKSREV